MEINQYNYYVSGASLIMMQNITIGNEEFS